MNAPLPIDGADYLLVKPREYATLWIVLMILAIVAVGFAIMLRAANAELEEYRAATCFPPAAHYPTDR